MNKKVRYVAMVMGAALGLSSCAVYDYPMYTSASVGVSGPGWSTSVAWSDARYDVNGFPIFGYAYGQPVYGYTASGAAVFTFAALTASCWVPSWGPAHWYCGHWHYPRHIHRVSCPPKYPAWHRPGRHGIAHHQPAAAPHRPAVNHRPGNLHKPVVNHRPGGQHKPVAHPEPGNMRRPVANHKPAVNPRPGVANRPAQKPSGVQRPGAFRRPAAAVAKRPQMNRPSVSASRPQMSSPAAAPRPQMSRPAVSRPAGGGGHRMGGGGHRGHHR